MCDFPLWGDIVAMVAPKEPDKVSRKDYHKRGLPKGEDILHGRAALLCRCCAGWIPDEDIRKLRSTLVATRLERTQVEAFDGYAINALLKLGKAAKAETESGAVIPGAFIVGDKVLLYGSNTLTNGLLVGIQELLALGLPTIIKSELAEETGGA
jgi:hypothetical protein